MMVFLVRGGGGEMFFFLVVVEDVGRGGGVNAECGVYASFAQIESTQKPGDSRCFWHHSRAVP